MAADRYKRRWRRRMPQNDCYEAARAQFNEKEVVDLTLAIVAINGANRLNIAFRTIPGDYQVARVASIGR